MLSSTLSRKLSLCLYLCFLALSAACGLRYDLPEATSEMPPTGVVGTAEPTLYWWRDGGIVGFCDGLAVWETDWIAVSTCELGDLDRRAAVPLPAAQRRQMESWVQQFASFEWEQADPPQASDRLRIVLRFNGQGSQIASQDDKEALMAFAADLFALMSRSTQP